MTTSFTTTEQFGTQMGDGFDETQYPEAFGITFTPKVTGISIGVAGLLIAGYLLWSQVLPVWGELSQLQKDKADKQAQVDQLNNNQLQLKVRKKKAELEASKQLKVDVTNLFANDESLEALLLDTSNLANLANLKLNSYAPSFEKKKVDDESFGTLATNNLQVQQYNLALEGTFAQLQIFLQDLERLKPLLVVNNFNIEAENQNYLFKNNQLSVQGQPKLKGKITLNAIFPDVQPPPAEPPPAGQPPAEPPK